MLGSLLTPAENHHSFELSSHLRNRTLALMAGATQRANLLGYNIDLLRIGPGGLSFRRVNSILRTRNTQGVLVLPFEYPQDWSEIEWERFSSVRMFNPLSQPLLHTVCPDHHQLLLHVLERVHGCGLGKVGLFLRRASEERICYKWTAAFHVFQQTVPVAERIPTLLMEQYEAATFLSWFDQYQPDVLIGHSTTMIDLLTARGVAVPEDVAFINLNVGQALRPCAGLDLRPDLLGATAVDAVIAQINRNERGVPAHPQTVLIEGSLVPGPTLQAWVDLHSGKSRLSRAASN